jgi:hypothetical protein
MLTEQCKTESASLVAAKSIWKYAFWTVIGAAVEALVNLIPTIQLPPYSALIIGAALKGLASFVATKIAEGKP